MRQLMKRAAAAAVAICAVAGVLNATPAPAAEPFRLGILGGQALSQGFSSQHCVMRALADGLRRPVEVIALQAQPDLQAALIQGTVDMAVLSARAYSALWRADPAAVQPVLAPAERGGSKGYRAVALARAESGFAGLDSLKGKEIGFSDRRSLPGYFVPSIALERAGLRTDRDFGRIQFSGGNRANMTALESGAIDAALAWVPDGSKAGPLSLPALRQTPDVVEIWRSALVPNGPIVVRKALTEQTKTSVTAVLDRIGAATPDCLAAAFGRPITGLFPVGHADYETFIEADQKRISLSVASN